MTYDDVKVDAPATGMFCQDDKPFILYLMGLLNHFDEIEDPK